MVDTSSHPIDGLKATLTVHAGGLFECQQSVSSTRHSGPSTIYAQPVAGHSETISRSRPWREHTVGIPFVVKITVVARSDMCIRKHFKSTLTYRPCSWLHQVGHTLHAACGSFSTLSGKKRDTCCRGQGAPA